MVVLSLAGGGAVFAGSVGIPGGAEAPGEPEWVGPVALAVPALVVTCAGARRGRVLEGELELGQLGIVVEARIGGVVGLVGSGARSAPL